MKKFYFSILLLNICLCTLAQKDEAEVWKEASKKSRAYNTYRLEITEPPYGLNKVRSVMSKIHPDESDNEAASQKNYLSLSLREKFTYHMIHPESYAQNCSIMPPIQDEQKKIFAQLPSVFNDFRWSDRQSKFFKENRDSVIELMKLCISKNKRVGLNFKHVIVDINAKEMIPLLISTYNIEKKDHDVLTVLMLLMKQNKYDQFMTSSSNKKLYADEDTSYQSYLNFNTANEELIIKRATDFYNGLHQ